jgi:asparagine synthase (glutamine-hydrolysing)
MRLICGLVHLDGKAADRGLLRAMAAQMDVPRLHPRLTLWNEGAAALALLDFSGRTSADLPNEGANILAADVRLDEPRRLARTFGRDDAAADDELLLAIMRHFGPSALNRVLGDFAFAYWDRTAGRLICGRDAMGIRPLSYVHRPRDVFAFASLPNALHGVGIVQKTIDEDALVRRLDRNFRHDDNLVAGIKRVPPAHFLELDHGEITLRRYWQFDRATVGRSRCSPEEAAREMRRLVTEAVRCRLPRDGKVGAQLSGGIDSGAITVLAARELRTQGRQLHAYSLLDRRRNDINLPDESEYIAEVLRQEADIAWTPLHRSAASPADANVFDIDTMSVVPDKPNQLVVAAEADGTSLMLSGWGGDEGASFSGRGGLAELFLRGKWRLLAREISALKSYRNAPLQSVVRREIFSWIWNDSAPAAVLSLLKRATGKESDLRSIRRKVLAPAVRRRLAASGDKPLRLAADGRENRWRLLTGPHISARTEKEAQIAARHGVAFAFPLLDLRVVEFALTLPSEFFVRDGVRRRVFRDAMAAVLPPKVRDEERKLDSQPSIAIDVVARRDEYLAKIDAYQNNDIIRRTLDLDWLRRQAAAFPSVDEVREQLRAGRRPAEATTIAAVTAGLAVAAYLEQHGGHVNVQTEP